MDKSTNNLILTCGKIVIAVVGLSFAFGLITSNYRLVILLICIITAALGCSALFGSLLSIKIYLKNKGELKLSIFGFILGLIISFIAFFISVTVFKSVV